MRLRSIGFAPFGALRDLTINLAGPPDALHVVYGPNEAGKSTALRGLIGFFFGIEHQSRDQHERGVELRVRTTIDAGDGRVLDLVRRKGRKDTLRDGVTDAPVDDHVLRRWIGGLDEATFRQLHALDHVRLREGAEAILRGQGRLGELMLEASTGATGLADRLEKLRDEAQALYKPRGRSDALHVAQEDWLAAQRASAQAMLSHGSWQEQEHGIEETRRRVAEADVELAAARREQAQLDRLLAVREAAARLRRRRASRSALGSVVDVGEGAAALRDEHLRDAAEAAGEVDRAERDLIELRAAASAAERRAAAVPPSFDAARGRELRTRLEHARAQRLEAFAELDALDRALAAGAARLGPPPSGAGAWSALDVNAQRVARAQARAAERREATLARVGADRAAAEAVSRRARLGDAGAPPPGESPADEATSLSVAIAAGRHAAVAARNRDELAAREVDLAARQAAAVIATGAATAQALGEATAPDGDAIGAEDRARAGAAARAEAESRDLEASWDRAARARTALDALQGGGRVPSLEELEEARSRRDALLAEAAQALDAGDARRAAPILRAFTDRVHAADALADRLRHEAARVEHAAQLAAEHRAAEARSGELGEHLETTRAEAAARLQAWESRWPALAGKDADAARAWCERRAAALVLAAELEGTRRRHEELDAEVRGVFASLELALGSAGGADAPRVTAAALDAALTRAEHAAEALARQRRACVERAAAIERAEEDVATAQREQSRAAAAEAQAATALGELVAPFGLGSDASAEEVTTVLSTLAESTRDRRQRGEVAARLERLDHEIDAAEAAWDADARAAGLEGIAAGEVLQRADAAREARADGRRLEDAVAARLAALAAAKKRETSATARLAELVHRTGVPVDELAEAEARARAARELDREIRELEATIVDRLGTTTLAEAEARLRDVNFDVVAERADRIAETLQEIESRRDRDQRAIGGREQGLALLGGESKASELAETAAAHLARARALARRAAVARAAVALLEREVERHRSEREGPVLRRASDLFVALTEQRWSGLRASEGEDGEPEIRCIRDGKEHPVGALSQGTADQLYLALRLAALEHHARGGAQLPLVLDDVLVHFDEERMGAALVALADVARSVQVLLFTHERKVADAARERLGARAIVHDLPRTR